MNRRLTYPDVRRIRYLLENTELSVEDIGQKCGVSHSTVGRLSHKKTYDAHGWSHKAKFNHKNLLIRPSKTKLSAEKAREIIRKHALGVRTKVLMAEYRVSRTAIRDVINGKTWYVEGASERKLLDHMR